MMNWNGYSPRKAAQVVAFFAASDGGEIEIFKLSGLVYLADREFMARYDMPILFDAFIQTNFCPMNLMTSRFISGQNSSDDWNAFVNSASEGIVEARINIGDVDLLDELNDAEVDVLKYIWDELGHKQSNSLRVYMEEHCREWRPPHGMPVKLSYEALFDSLGKQNPSALCDHIDMMRALSAAPGIDDRDLPSLSTRNVP